MAVQSLTGKPLRHYAQDTISKRRYIVLALENDNDTNKCTVVDIDSLQANIRAELVEVTNSDECQRQANIWRVLDKKFFMDYPKATMLNVLRSLKQLKEVNSNQVAVQLPNDQTMSPKEIADCIRSYNEQQSKKSPSLEIDNNSIAVPQNNDEIDEIKSEIASMKEMFTSMTSMVSELTKALKDKNEE